MTNLDEIGSVHRTFVFESPRLAKLAWERTNKRARNISAWRHKDMRDESVHYVTLLGEPAQAAMVDRMARLLEGSGGTQVEAPAELIESLRNRRRRVAVEVATDQSDARNMARFGEGGAFATRDGRLILRKRQG